MGHFILEDTEAQKSSVPMLNVAVLYEATFSHVPFSAFLLE